jgi:hypothetical protein
MHETINFHCKPAGGSTRALWAAQWANASDLEDSQRIYEEMYTQ